MSLLIIASIKFAQESHFLTSVSGLFAIFYFYKYTSIGDVSLWDRITFRIDSTGIQHYKFGLIPWDKIYKTTRQDIKSRGIKTGERILLHLTESLAKNQSQFRQKWAGILFQDYSIINIPISLLNCQNNEIFLTIEAYSNQFGAKSLFKRHDELMLAHKKAVGSNAPPAEINFLEQKLTASFHEVGKHLPRVTHGDPTLEALYIEQQKLDEKYHHLFQQFKRLDLNKDLDHEAQQEVIVTTDKLTSTLEKLNKKNADIAKREIFLRQERTKRLWIIVLVGIALAVILLFSILNL